MTSIPGRGGQLLLVFVTGACSAGTASEAVRPEAPSAASALGEAECRDVRQGGRPLIVDWNAAARGELELAMKEGVAVVAYSCEGIELLADCRLDGDYGFIGMTRREQVVRLSGGDELRANLPLSGVRLSSELERGTTLDIAMMLVGKKRTTWHTPTKADLQGSCRRATHFVRGAIVGAFAMSTGSQATLRAAAEIFGSGARTASQSARSTENRDGDVGDCQKARPDSEQPPAQCGAPIRLVLAPLVERPPADGKAVPAEPGCPDGLVFSGDKCVLKSAVQAYECQPYDLVDCGVQCERGNAASCGRLGADHARRGDPGAAALLGKACDGGHARSCAGLGVLLAGAAEPKPAEAVRLFEKSCNAADPVGCRELGRAYLTGGAGLPVDENRAGLLLRQACDGGDHQSCSALGAMAEEGRGGPVDAVRAAQLYKRGCDGGLGEACAGAGRIFGSGQVKNEILARIAYQRGCLLQSGAACTGAGRLAYKQAPEQAKQEFVQACNLQDELGCAALKLLFGDPRPVLPSIELTGRLGAACRTGSAADCASLGVLEAARGQSAPARINLQNACTRGDGFACSVLEKLR